MIIIIIIIIIEFSALLSVSYKPSPVFIQEQVGWLVGWVGEFYGILTLVGYLMPNPVYLYWIWFVNE